MGALPDIIGFLTEGFQAIGAFVLAFTVNVYGFFLIGNAIYKVVQSSRRSSGDVGYLGQAVRAGIGSLLTQASAFIEGIVVAITQKSVDAAGPMSVMPAVGGEQLTKVLQLGFVACFVFGTIAIIRGASLWASAADGGGQGSKSDSSPAFVGAVYIFSGAIGINAWRFSSYLI